VSWEITQSDYATLIFVRCVANHCQLGPCCDGCEFVVTHIHSLTEAGGIARAELRRLTIGAVEQGNGCRYASTWRALLGDVGKRLDSFRRVLARKLLDAVIRFRATTRIAALAFLKTSVHLF
jgi:hypothetical protein